MQIFTNVNASVAKTIHKKFYIKKCKKGIICIQKKVQFFHERGAIAPNAPPQFWHWYMNKMIKVKGRKKSPSAMFRKRYQNNAS